GIAMGIAEQVRNEHWLDVVSGGMAGKQFILDHDATPIGSGPNCNITLVKDASISAHHVTLRRIGDALVAEAMVPATVTVNGVPSFQHTLRDGDVVQIGSTVVRYCQKAPSA